MRIFRFGDWPIKFKIMSITILTLIVILIGIHFFLTQAISDRLIYEKKMTVKGAVDVLISTLNAYETRVQRGEFPREEAQARALRNLVTIRYNRDNYFWITDMKPVMLLHPLKPELNGQDVTNYQDKHGNQLFKRAADIIKNDGSGFIEYYWPKGEQTKATEKISYVAEFKPWGWIIGSGAYVDDIKEDIAKISKIITLITLILTLVILIMAYSIADYITKPLNEVVNALDRVAEGNLDIKIRKKNNDETGVVITRLNNMITERKKAEDELKEKTDELDKFFSLNLYLLCISDKDGYIKKVNPVWEPTLGYKPEELIGKRIIDFVHPDDQEITEKNVQNIALRHNIIDFANRYRCKDGSYKWIEWRSFPAGNLVYAAARDIDERKKAEEMLMDKNRELNDFAYRVSHDLKNPVNIINGYMELLAQEPDMLQEFVPRIREQNDKILAFIDSLLKLSRAGRVIDNKIDMEIENIFNLVEAEVKNSHQKVEFSYEITNKTVWGDLDSIYLLIRNIFENAIKYRDTNKETIKISVKCYQNDNHSVISISDNGIGIKPEDHERVFKPGITLEKNKGTGFGLAIAKRIVTAHGGVISVDSKGENQGTTFIINLPLPEKE